MIYIEMSREEGHGGGTWAFPTCIWAPTEKQGGGAWPFWTKVFHVRMGDTIIHLRGKQPNAYFVGHSTASCDGFETDERPPEPGIWSFAKSFYRANLNDYTPFDRQISLTDLFSTRRPELEAYFEANKDKGYAKLNLFYVKQSGRIQCLNGAYCSDIDDELLSALFGRNGEIDAKSQDTSVYSVATRTQISQIRTRVGQEKFSTEIKRAYGSRCCFPGCNVTDARFLIGSHIARWSDNEALRGNLGNGLCLCVIHDRAFELGIYTLDQQFCVFVNRNERSPSSPVVRELLKHHGRRISRAEIKPLQEALREHRARVGIVL